MVRAVTGLLTTIDLEGGIYVPHPVRPPGKVMERSSEEAIGALAETEAMMEPKPTVRKAVRCMVREKLFCC